MRCYISQYSKGATTICVIQYEHFMARIVWDIGKLFLYTIKYSNLQQK